MDIQKHDQSRKRSRSPYRSEHHDRDVKRSRSRSPYRRKHQHERERQPKARLPFGNPHLHKRDLEAYKSLLAEYLDVQKQLDVHALNEDELKGRWKSFLHKWNAGELAEGWYDPEVKRKADARAAESDGREVIRQPKKGKAIKAQAQAPDKDSDNEDDDYGPALPTTTRTSGPTVPGFQDLQHRQELSHEEREAQKADLRYDRKLDRKAQQARLDELAPRADPGSRERQLEKKREVTAGNRAFADAKETGADEVGDAEMMGGDEGIKKEIKEQQRKKGEREVRKEEMLRARAAEREERMVKFRAKEEKTMDMLRGLARQRFGGGGGGGGGEVGS